MTIFPILVASRREEHQGCKLSQWQLCRPHHHHQHEAQHDRLQGGDLRARDVRRERRHHGRGRRADQQEPVRQRDSHLHLQRRHGQEVHERD